ncbi:MAG: nucleotide exchange factor GrpE [Flavobacterium sp. MedPE-SWcel]|uniref:nucleotide exchange factor GrpE n=1 Tax=uncultured Flavobacterium sp. TaxID=165435 RepID=UPI00090FCA0F|nr:nucleotide exchange factor GrpE [uncultured Flavobacterium sp.]OIQ16207.1 MAG: nucleotide exchange factor GrpE [Flavobacterium sp. MedPE-SWcel]
MFKKIFKNMSQENSESQEKDIKNEDIAIENETVNENEAEAPEVEELTEEEKLKEELAKEKDKFLRLFAEFENYKKRTSKERVELFKTANQEVLLALLPVMDDFDRALVEIAKSENEELLKGVELIHNKFSDTLKSKGLEQVEVRTGDTFNADFAEAITQIPAPSDDLKGKIVDVIEKGYKLGDKIIRFPKVVLGN